MEQVAGGPVSRNCKFELISSYCDFWTRTFIWHFYCPGFLLSVSNQDIYLTSFIGVITYHILGVYPWHVVAIKFDFWIQRKFDCAITKFK